MSKNMSFGKNFQQRAKNFKIPKEKMKKDFENSLKKPNFWQIYSIFLEKNLPKYQKCNKKTEVFHSKIDAFNNFVNNTIRTIFETPFENRKTKHCEESREKLEIGKNIIREPKMVLTGKKRKYRKRY